MSPDRSSAAPRRASAELGHHRWLLLFHHLPPKPAYFRVKIWRCLARIGAVALKSTVYALPQSAASLEVFQGVRREIVDGGGEATICEARLVDGLTNEEVEASFRQARDNDYAQLAQEARQLLASAPHQTEAQRAALGAELASLRRRLSEVVALDFFAATGRLTVESLLTQLGDRTRVTTEPPQKPTPMDLASLQGRTWVTRKCIQFDRIACAWLIRRFIDPAAQFKFVPGRYYKPQPGELRYAMAKAEFTPEGGMCSFEVMVKRCGLTHCALLPIAEIVHDIDRLDGRFNRSEAAGIASLIAGIAQRHRDDEARLAQGCDAFEALYEHFSRKR